MPRPRRAYTLLLACCALVAGCRTPPAPVSTVEEIDTMTWEPDWSILTLDTGDVLRVVVSGHDNLSSPLEGSTVEAHGALTLPLIGALDVRGLTVQQANEAANAAFAEYMHEPDVTITMLRRESKRFHIVGHIREPGPYSIEAPLTALDALAHGGFFLHAADYRNVFLLRPHGEHLEVHRFNAATPDHEGLVQVHPGDVIFVRRKGTQRFQEEVLPLLAPLTSIAPTAVALHALN